MKGRLYFKANGNFTGTIGSNEKVYEGTHVRFSPCGDTFNVFIEGRQVDKETLKMKINDNYYSFDDLEKMEEYWSHRLVE